ncbi:MAG: NAD-dependent epimerase/dehydratase family protein [Iodobacter sp.]
MKVSVTGGSGFIGKKLVENLLELGHQVTVLTRKSQENGDPRIKYIQADLNIESNMLASFLNDCDVLFHCAGEIKNPLNMRALHVDGTKRLIDAAEKATKLTDKKIHWIQLSSVGAYGPDQRAIKNVPRVVIESTPPNPSGEYETTKTESDNAVIEAAEQGAFSYTIIRPSNVFGKGMPNQSIRSMISIIKKGLFFYIGKNDAISTYIHVDDVVDCLLMCCVNEKAKGQIFNISNDCKQDDFVNAIADHANVSRPKIRLPEWLVRTLVATLGRVTHLPLTNDRINALRTKTTYPAEKIEQLLGIKPKRDVTLYIKEIIEEI